MKLSPLSPICIGLFVSVAANCQVATPSIGYVRYTSDAVRGVYGLEGNYIVGRNVLAASQAGSFSDLGGLIFNSGSLALVDPKLVPLSTTHIEDSDVIVRMDGGLNTAVAWLPGSRALVHWNGESFVTTPVALVAGDDAVTSVRKLDANTASLLISKADNTIVRYRLSLETGEIKSSTSVPNAFGYGFEIGDRIICFRDGKLLVLSQTGETLQALALPVAGTVLIEQVSARCLHLSTKKPGQDWLLHLDGTEIRVYRLPAPKTVVATTSVGAEFAQ